MEYSIILIIASIFYLIIPGLGIIWVRQKWQQFRSLILKSALSPLLKYSTTREISREGYIGNYRFFGELQAMGAEESIWLTNESMSIKVSLSGAHSYILPSASSVYEVGSMEYFEEPVSSEIPQKIYWKKIFTLSERSKIFVSGPLYKAGDNVYFKRDSADALLVIIYDGDAETVLRRATWSGRHKNEYWNLFTPVSLVSGSFSLLIYAYMLLRNPLLKSEALLGILLSLLPILPLLPPGIFLYFIYRDFWKKGRRLRAERDILLLPERFFKTKGEKIDLQDQQIYFHEVSDSLESLIAKNSRFKLRFSSVSPANWRELDLHAYYIKDKVSGEILKPKDPMIEELIIPGNPKKLSEKASVKGHRFELQALFFLFAGLLLNYILFYQLLRFFIIA